MEGLKWLLEGNDARVRAGLQHLLQGRRIEVCPEPEEGEAFRLEANMLLFASPLCQPPNEDETPGEEPRASRACGSGGFVTSETPGILWIEGALAA
jgi:hypothetical protein